MLWTVDVQQPALSVAFSPDGSLVVSGSSNTTVQLRSVETGDMISLLEGHMGVVYSVAFSPDGSRVVSRSSDNTFRLWFVETGVMISVLGAFTLSWNLSVAFSPNGKVIVLKGRDQNSKWWMASMSTPITEREAAVHWPLGTSILRHTNSVTIEDNWLVLGGLHICKLDAQHEIATKDEFGSCFVVGTRSGRVIIFDLSHLPSFFT